MWAVRVVKQLFGCACTLYEQSKHTADAQPLAAIPHYFLNSREKKPPADLGASFLALDAGAAPAFAFDVAAFCGFSAAADLGVVG